eukprot:Em0003g1185a
MESVGFEQSFIHRPCSGQELCLWDNHMIHIQGRKPIDIEHGSERLRTLEVNGRSSDTVRRLILSDNFELLNRIHMPAVMRETFSSSESSDTDQRNSENSSNCSDEDSEMIEDDSCPEADGFVSDEEVIGIDDNGQQENVLSHETVNITQYITNFDSANSEIGYDSAIRCTEAVPFEQLFSNSEQEDDLSSEAVDIAEHVVNFDSANSEIGYDSAIRCTEAVPFEQLFSNSEQEDDLSSEAVDIAEHVVNVGSENSECGNDSAIRCTEAVPFEQLFSNSEQEDDLSSEAVNIAEHVVNVGSENSECGNDSIRVDISQLSDEVPHYPLHIDVYSILPSPLDDNTLSSNIATLVSRVLCKHMKFFNVSFDDVVQWHIHHKYYKEMSQKSQVVPLGIILKNENKIDEMTEILTDLHQYVPCVTQEESASLSTGQVVTKKTEYMHRILIGGDQLTVARMRSAINIKNNSWTATGRLEGFIPVAEDWHTKAIYLDMPSKHLKATKVKEQFCVFPKLLESLFQFFQTMMMIIM